MNRIEVPDDSFDMGLTMRSFIAPDKRNDLSYEQPLELEHQDLRETLLPKETGSSAKT